MRGAVSTHGMFWNARWRHGLMMVDVSSEEWMVRPSGTFASRLGTSGEASTPYLVFFFAWRRLVNLAEDLNEKTVVTHVPSISFSFLAR